MPLSFPAHLSGRKDAWDTKAEDTTPCPGKSTLDNTHRASFSPGTRQTGEVEELGLCRDPALPSELLLHRENTQWWGGGWHGKAVLHKDALRWDEEREEPKSHWASVCKVQDDNLKGTGLAIRLSDFLNLNFNQSAMDLFSQFIGPPWTIPQHTAKAIIPAFLMPLCSICPSRPLDLCKLWHSHS